MSGDECAGDPCLRAGVPAVFVVAGPSMEPGLRPGCRLRVVPLDGAPAPGEIVVLRSGAARRVAGGDARCGDDAAARASAGGPGVASAAAAPAFVVHRVVWVGDVGGRRVVFHRGDAGGRVGVTSCAALVGCVVEVLAAPGTAAPAVPSLDGLDAAHRRAFGRAQRRCRVYVALRRVVARAGLAPADEGTFRARAGALVRRVLLRA